MRQLRWGIIGGSRIAANFGIPAIRTAGDEVRVVAARDPATAARYAREHHVDEACGYHELLDRHDIDVIYIALPPAKHAEMAAAALRAGKAVLCEKPPVTGSADARVLLEAAVEASAPFLDGFMYHHLPHIAYIRSLLAEGHLGTIRTIRAALCAPAPSAGDYRLDATLGGGVLLDLGSYALDLANRLLHDSPLRAAGRLIERDGVDVQCDLVLWHEAGPATVISCVWGAAWVVTPLEIRGTNGMIRVDHAFNPGLDPVEVQTLDARGRTHRRDFDGHDAFALEVARLREQVLAAERTDPEVLRAIPRLGEALDVCRRDCDRYPEDIS